MAMRGYYTKERTIGKEGDFYTAVSTSMFFGGSIAKRLISTIESGFLSSSSYVVEIGAHKGYLLADMIQFIYTLKPELLKNPYICYCRTLCCQSSNAKSVL